MSGLEEGSKELQEARLAYARESIRRRYAELDRITHMTSDERVEQLVQTRDRLVIQGVRVFGSIAAFRRWMDLPSVAFDGERPNVVAQDHSRHGEVYEELDRIARGDLS